MFYPDEQDVAEAFRRSKSLGVPPSSYTHGIGRMTGFLGEVAFGKYIESSKHVGEQCYTHDYLYNNKKVDPKYYFSADLTPDEYEKMIFLSSQSNQSFD